VRRPSRYQQLKPVDERVLVQLQLSDLLYDFFDLALLDHAGVSSSLVSESLNSQELML
jgi:hypothetical protein